MQPVILAFDAEKEELTLRIGNEQVIIPTFLQDSTGKLHQCTLSSHGQELVIKKLVANMKLTFLAVRY